MGKKSKRNRNRGVAGRNNNNSNTHHSGPGGGAVVARQNHPSPREEADRLMLVFEGYPSARENDMWNNRERIMTFGEYLDKLKAMNFSLSNADKEFLGKIRHSETETLFCRYLAMSVSIDVWFENEEYSDALGFGNEAVELHDSANAMENEMLENVFEEPISTRRRTVADNAEALAVKLAKAASAVVEPPADTRAEANRLMHEFEGYPTTNERDLWNVKRLNTMYSYFELLFIPSIISCTDKDLEFLKKIRRSKTEAVLCRLWALLLSARFSFTVGDPCANFLWYVRKATNLCKSACERKKEHIIHLGGSVYKVVDYLDLLRKRECTAFLKSCDKFTLSGLSPDRTRIIPVAMVAGLNCDNCEKSLKEKGVEAFQFCSSCRLEFYCSPECQRVAWKDNGHKTVCRKKGEYKVGDIVTTTRSFGGVSMGTRLRIVAPYPVDSDEENPHHWVVRTEKKTYDIRGNLAIDFQMFGYGSDVDVQVEFPVHFDAEQENLIHWVQQSEEGEAIDFAIIPLEQLKRVRPAMWYPFRGDEFDIFRNIVFAQQENGYVGENDERDDDFMPDLAFPEDDEL